MNKTWLIGILLVAILAIGASAAEVSVSSTSLSSGARAPTETFSVSFTVNSTVNITSLKLASSVDFSDFKINFTVGGVPGDTFSLTGGAPKTVAVNGIIPEDVNTRQTFIGNIVLSGGSPSITTQNVALSINAESQLDLDSVKILVDGSSKSVDDGDNRKDVTPGSKLEIKGDIRNLFTDSQDIVIEDVTVTVTIKNIDDDDDLEEEADVGDIDADNKESFSVKFEVPEDIDADEYDVEIVVEGDDENGASHFVEWDNLKITVEKDNHDIVIRKATVNPTAVDCSRNINLNVDLKNQGENDEDEVVVRLENSALGINVEDTSVPEIEEGTGDDTEYSKSYPFAIGDKVKAGTYPITVKVYYDTDTLSDSETVNLVVSNCVVEEEQPEEVVVVTPPTEQPEETEEQPEIITTPTTETTETTSLLGSNSYLVFLIAAVGVAVLVIIVMIIVLFTMRKRE